MKELRIFDETEWLEIQQWFDSEVIVHLKVLLFTSVLLTGKHKTLIYFSLCEKSPYLDTFYEVSSTTLRKERQECGKY